MSHKDNADLRNKGDGGWFYAENEFFSVFCPLIGPDGGMVYMAMCRLIPRAAVDPDRPVTKRSVSEASCVSKSTAQRKMALIVALGMVLETRSARKRPSTYKLVPLRDLALVGRDELARRCGVPPGDTGSEEEVRASVIEMRRGAAQGRASGPDDDEGGIDIAATSAASLTHLVETGVPRWDTNWSGAKVAKFAGDAQSVSQKRASVSHTEASVSQIGASVSHTDIPFNTEEEEEEEKNNPPTPASGGVAAWVGKDLVLPSNARPGEPGWDLALGVAARWVMHRNGLTGRLERVIAPALTQWVQATGRTLREAAELAANNLAEYRRLEGLGLLRVQYGVPNFFRHGKWQDALSWEIDRERAGGIAWANVGTRKADPSAALRDDKAFTRDDKQGDQEASGYILRNADVLAAKGCRAEFVKRLRDLAGDGPLGLEDVDERLQSLEDEIVAELVEAIPIAEMEELRKKAKAGLREYLPRMTKENAAEMVRLQVQRDMLNARGYPRLSLLHMNWGAL